MATPSITPTSVAGTLPELSHDEIRRYSRHLILDDVGVAGQRRLKGAKVLCIGSGLLGFANIGWMGDLYGGAAAVRIVALEGLVPLVLVVLFWRGAFAARHR